MPQTRRSVRFSSSLTKSPDPATPTTSKRTSRRSELAKENGLSATEESSIREAFRLFAIKHPNFKDEKNGVVPLEDVRRALIALGIPAASGAEWRTLRSTLDPTHTGFVPYAPFTIVCALKLHQSDTESGPEVEGDPSDSGYSPVVSGKGKGRIKGKNKKTKTEGTAELDKAYRLFTNGASGPISVGHLRRIAQLLKEDVSEEMLRDMILEANGGHGNEGIAMGVDREEFGNVMRRAGVLR